MLFIMFLSLASFTGLQASEATEVKCPSAKDLKITQQEDGSWMYEGTSAGRPFLFKNQTPYPTIKIPLDKTLAPAAGKEDTNNLSCTYYPDRKKKYASPVTLETGAEAAKDCKANPNKPSFFNCPDNTFSTKSKKEKKSH